jgi:uncharacterized membrane protein
MNRDEKIVLAVLAAIPSAMLGSAVLCTWAIAQGASMRLRLLFRMTCHGIAERCLVLWGVPMPICARCAGIYAGLLAGAALAALLPPLPERTMRRVMFASAVPMAIDGLTQLSGLRESVNALRIATGLAAGMAFGMWILSAMRSARKTVVTAS